MTVSTINMLEFLGEIVCLEFGLVGGIRGVLPVEVGARALIVFMTLLSMVYALSATVAGTEVAIVVAIRRRVRKGVKRMFTFVRRTIRDRFRGRNIGWMFQERGRVVIVTCGWVTMVKEC